LNNIDHLFFVFVSMFVSNVCFNVFSAFSHGHRAFRKAPSMKRTKVLKVYDDCTALRYLEYKGLPMVVSGRDFCNVHHWRYANENDGNDGNDGNDENEHKEGKEEQESLRAIHSVAYAEERLDLCPLVRGLVRGKLVIAGYVLEPVVGVEGGTKGGAEVMTKVTYVVKTDVGGSIPGWVIKLKSKEQPMQLLALKKMLDEEAQEYPGGKAKYMRDMREMS